MTSDRGNGYSHPHIQRAHVHWSYVRLVVMSLLPFPRCVTVPLSLASFPPDSDTSLVGWTMFRGGTGSNDNRAPSLNVFCPLLPFCPFLMFFVSTISMLPWLLDCHSKSGAHGSVEYHNYLPSWHFLLGARVCLAPLDLCTITTVMLRAGPGWRQWGL